MLFVKRNVPSQHNRNRSATMADGHIMRRISPRPVRMHAVIVMGAGPLDSTQRACSRNRDATASRRIGSREDVLVGWLRAQNADVKCADRIHVPETTSARGWSWSVRYSRWRTRLKYVGSTRLAYRNGWAVLLQPASRAPYLMPVRPW